MVRRPTFQEILRKLSLFWEERGCVIHQGYDLEVGAGTFNPATFLRCLGPEPYKAAYIEPSRRPTDGRYGTNPNRLQHYFQYQVMLKPSPIDIQDLYLKSLEAIGFNLSEHDIRFVHDDWESPTIGAWGLGWEVWMDGMECAQFTYFQSVAGVTLKPVTGEITYGIERLAMYLQGVSSIFDLQWNDELTYGDIYHRNEVEWSHYNFEHASTEVWFRHFEDYERESRKLMALNLPIPAYDFVMKASHAFNVLDARGAISVTERTGYISRIRDLAVQIAQSYLKSREEQGFPLLKKFKDKQNIAPSVPALSSELLHAAPTDTDTFLLEIGSEELPAAFVPIGIAQLEKHTRTLLEKESLTFSKISTYGTPRRLAISIEGLQKAKTAKSIEKRGPNVKQAFDENGNPTPAADGFFKSIQIAPLTLSAIKQGANPQVTIQPIKDAEYLFAQITTPSRPTAAILAEVLSNLILGLDFPKKMRWADLDIAYPRPLRWIVALFGTQTIPFALGNLVSNRETQGHRQLHPGTISLNHAKDYLETLRKHQVLADPKERRDSITQQLDQLEKTQGFTIGARDRVIPQVLHLVEYPHVTCADFDADFLRAPQEVIISEMVEHQKYFPVFDSHNTLQNKFVITADTNPSDQIRQGNQKVLAPRLKDGVFLYEQDLKTKFNEFNDKLKQVTFQKELGSVYDKVQRIKKHALTLQKALHLSTPQQVEHAAELCKADLASKMVYEFPELQGTMGRYYAQAAKEPNDIALSIEEHWMPRGENAPLPSTPIGTLLSLSDKIDNLIGCFSAGLKPTSSSDPYALRRQTLGIIKILINGHHRLHLLDILRQCFNHFPEEMQKNKETTLEEIKTFITNRIKTIFQDYGFRPDEIEASLASGFYDVYDTFCKVNALHQFRHSNNRFDLLYEVYKRAKGQIGNTPPLPFSPILLKENAEKQLDALLTSTETTFTDTLTTHHYDKAYEMISHVQPALDNLFNEVKVLADDPSIRDNRLSLLQRVLLRFSKLLDFSKIQVP